MVGAEEAPLLGNGDFEAVTKELGWPDGWGRPKDGGSWEADEGGGHFLRLNSTTPGLMVMLYRQVPVKAEMRALEFSWRWRCSGLKRGKQSWFDARFMLSFKDVEGKKVSPGPPNPNLGKSTDGWVTGSVKFLVPEGAVMLEVIPALFQVESGTLDLDDLVLKLTDPAPVEAEARAKAAALHEKQTRDAAKRHAKAAELLAKEGTLISNGSFEIADKKKSWPADWSGTATSAGMSWETGASGRHIRLESTTPDKTLMLFRVISLPADARALELTWRQRVTGLKPGKEPWFDARLLMEFKGMDGKKMAGAPKPPTSRKDTEGWVTRQTRFLVPEGAVTLELMPALFQVKSGTLELDDFVLTPTEPGPLIAEAKAAEEARLAAIVSVEQPRREAWPQPLHVEGRHVLNADGKPVRLQGVNVISLEWNPDGEQVMKACLVAIEQWKANIIRLPVAQKFWFATSGGKKDEGASYRQLVSDVVTLVANRGAYVLLDLHQFGAPTQEHADFWASAAPLFKNHPAVLFDLFNEPHGISWEIWQNGGEIPVKTKPGEEDAFISAEDKAKQAAARRCGHAKAARHHSQQWREEHRARGRPGLRL
ncbi:MAG: cellulase family glycosylhydrolase [Verrucomicrobiaceae bacterium]|nr:cellulase family glycosylhydrolase [Verrucomicrobiaceae bacterium]